MTPLKRHKVKALLTSQEFEQSVRVCGWVKTQRTGKKFSFCELNDGSGLHNLQVVVDNALIAPEVLKRAATGAAVCIEGLLVKSQGKEQAVELQAQKLEILGEADGETYPLQKKAHSLEFLREQAHLRSRTNTFGAVFRLRNAVSYAIHHYFYQKGFVYVHTPIITASDTEGAGEMFAVTTLPLDNCPKLEGQVDWKQDFFERPAHLTVSGQLNAELAALGLGEVYTFGPTFRAENSNTTRHLAEFWMVEPEMAFYDLADNMALAEDFLKYLIRWTLDHNRADIDFLQENYEPGLVAKLEGVLASDFIRLDYTEAVSILQESGRQFEYPVQWGSDLQSEHERYLVEQHFGKPVIVINYPKDIKAFYMRLNADEKTVAAMDILFPGIGEIIGGSQREERPDVLLRRLHEMGLPEENYWWYLDTRRYGSAPHAGFGLGLERILMFITGMGNIRDVIPFPRTPGNAEF
ncbi:MAG: asparagine--tRNA ligase [Bacteroidetes bacterium]|nr:asparagine--tRNA ligase [Bacteroidota bacterium]